MKLPSLDYGLYFVERISTLEMKDIDDFVHRLMEGCSYCNLMQESFMKCCGKPIPDYLVHDPYFPEPDALEWTRVPIGFSCGMTPRIFNDSWISNLGDIWFSTSITRYFA